MQDDVGYNTAIKTSGRRNNHPENFDDSNQHDTDEEFQGSPGESASRRQLKIERSVQDAHDLMEQKFDKLEIINRPPKNMASHERRSGRGAQPQG